jgi:thiol:disulfide interchange protein DsbG
MISRRPALFVLGCVFAVSSVFSAAQAQNAAQPPMPDTLSNLAAKGAQVRYLGRERGLDGWITIYQGQEQYFYVTPDGEAIVMGLLFGKDGKMITVRQIQKLQQGGDPTLESLVSTAEPPAEGAALAALQEQISKQARNTTSPAESMFAEIESSNWIMLGNQDAPVIYAFLDPQCPHCHEFMKDIRKDYIDSGLLQVRMIPVGFQEETKIQSAVLLAAPDAAARWFRHLDGDASALPISSDVNRQAVEKNMSVMQSWKLDATPMVIYRSSKGQVKIIRGRPKNPLDILNDLG